MLQLKLRYASREPQERGCRFTIVHIDYQDKTELSFDAWRFGLVYRHVVGFEWSDPTARVDRRLRMAKLIATLNGRKNTCDVTADGGFIF